MRPSDLHLKLVPVLDLWKATPKRGLLILVIAAQEREESRSPPRLCAVGFWKGGHYLPNVFWWIRGLFCEGQSGVFPLRMSANVVHKVHAILRVESLLPTPRQRAQRFNLQLTRDVCLRAELNRSTESRWCEAPNKNNKINDNNQTKKQTQFADPPTASSSCYDQ